jgi:M6 family metalloprotease-like protein
MKKLLNVAKLAFVGLILSSCSLYDWISGKLNSNSVQEGGPLISSTKTGSTYGGTSLSFETGGTNYTAQGTSFNQFSLDDSNGYTDFPAQGINKILVIPVSVRGYEKNATDTVRQDIYDTFFGDPSETGWESVASFYFKSSFKQCLLQGSVAGWWDSGRTAEEIVKLSDSYTGKYSDYYQPTWTLLEEAVSWYKAAYSTSATEFDNNSDGVIDGVWLVYDCPDYGNDKTMDKDTFWAYTYYDYGGVVGKTFKVANPLPFHYCWASYDFMYEMKTLWSSSKVDAHTYIHETGHLMGLEDYYNTDGNNNAPMGFVDMMDANVIDHDAYSKFAFGWIKPYVVTGSTTITLKPSSTTGQSILLPTNGGWNGSAFDEYILLEFYTPTNLNAADASKAYSNGVKGFTESGVRIYHVDARLALLNSDGTASGYTDSLPSSGSNTGIALAHSNTSSSNYLNKTYRLIQEMDCTEKRNFDTNAYRSSANVADNGTLFQNGNLFTLGTYSNSFPRVSVMNDGTSLPYSVSFSNMSTSSITVTVTKS